MPVPLPVILNTFRVALDWVGGAGQTATNVMHVRSHTGGKTGNDVATAIAVNIQANQWGACSNSAFISQLAVTPLDGVSGTTLFPLGNVAPYKGAAAGDWIPQASVLLKFSTGLRGRNKRGRMYLPFIGEGVASSGFISTSDANTVKTAWQTFQTNLGLDATTPCDLVVASYDRAHAGAGAQENEVTQIFCELALGTQRRRQSRLR